MPKNPSYTTLTTGQTFYLEVGPNEGTKVKVTKVRCNKYETFVEYEGHNGLRVITGEVSFSKWAGSSHVITNPTSEQRLKFVKATAKRVAEYAEKMEEEQREKAHEKAFVEAHRAEVDAPLVWSEPRRSVGRKGRIVRYTSTATRKVLRGSGFNIRLEDDTREVCTDLHLQADDSTYDEATDCWVHTDSWVVSGSGAYGLMDLETGLAYFQCLERALKELNDLSAQEPNAPVAVEEAVTV